MRVRVPVVLADTQIMEALCGNPATDCGSMNAVVITDACPCPAVGPHSIDACSA